MDKLFKIFQTYTEVQLPEPGLCKLCQSGGYDHPKCKGCGMLAGEGHLAFLNRKGYCQLCSKDLKRLPEGVTLEPSKPTMPLLWLYKQEYTGTIEEKEVNYAENDNAD